MIYRNTAWVSFSYFHQLSLVLQIACATQFMVLHHGTWIPSFFPLY